MSAQPHRVAVLSLLPLLFIAVAHAQEPAPPGELIDLGGMRLHLHCTITASPAVIVHNGGGSFSVE